MIRLELLEKEDLNKILEWNNGKSSDFLLQWAGPLYQFPLTINQLEDYYINDVKKVDSSVFVYKIVLTGTDEIIGTVELREIDKEKRVGRVCRFLIGDDSARGKGVGTIALKEILKIGFVDLNFDKITLAVFDFNEGAIKCYQKTGFKKVKFIENARKAIEGYWNLYEMAVSKAEWDM
jgi:RimJ/RimL family protein N-acetyltransferase